MPAPVAPLVAAAAEHPEIAQPVPIEQREILLAVVEGDVGFAGGHVKRHAELVIGGWILQHRSVIIVKLLQRGLVDVTGTVDIELTERIEVLKTCIDRKS